jgi:hypothetical protein
LLIFRRAIFLLSLAMISMPFFAGPALAQNAIVLENQLPGNPPSEWEAPGIGDASIGGFAVDLSVDQGQAVEFKIDTPSTDYRIDIYRLGWYGGDGARLVATVEPSATLPQVQPACLNDAATGLVDCGNWATSASWAVPSNATSGLYLARLVREDPDTGLGTHVPFVVRDDDGGSEVLFQTADTTWQAYNAYGGNSLYAGSPAGRAYKVSYNRPFTTRNGTAEDWIFNAEFPMIRWLERNGYDVSYATGIDSDRSGGELLEHGLFLSIGHDEYWSGPQRTAVEAARDAGVHLAFFSGNEVFWKIRWEPSTDGSATPHRTMVSYKETHANAKIDPLPGEWTGTWRDPRAFNPEGPQPENALTGQIFTVNCCTYEMQVPAEYGALRFWRNTDIATLAPGTTATLSDGSLGYEWDEDLEDAARPAGLIRMSETTVSVPQRIQDYGSSYGPGTATHHLTLYRAGSGALVFGAGTVQWSWGLDDTHDRGSAPTDARMQQATVNLFADMGVQPEGLQAGLVAATQTMDATPPTSIVTSASDGDTVPGGSVVSGTALDAEGVVAGVEISYDGGTTWQVADGTDAWTHTLPVTPGPITLMTRAADDSANLEVPGAGIALTIAEPECPCSLWDDAFVPGASSFTGAEVELGMKFRSDEAGVISALRFYRSPDATGSHTGRLWAADGTLLAEETYPSASGGGWQEVALTTPVPIQADTTYIVSYHTPNDYVAEPGFFASSVAYGPLTGLADGTDGPNGVFFYGPPGSFPTDTFNAGNYYVDVVFEDTPGPECPCGLWDDSVVPGGGSFAGNPIELGTKFEVAEAGLITALRFYRSPNATGAHSGRLWLDDGTLLAEETYPAAVGGGWQEVALTTPIAVQPGTTYIVSYHTEAHYQAEGAYFTTSFQNGPVTALADSVAGGNGVYVEAPAGTFPNNTFNATNYWADVVFEKDTVSPCPCGLWDDTFVPAGGDFPDDPVELGTKFRVDVPGFVTSFRFYRSPIATGPHTGRLWASDGTLLAEETYPPATGAGWQQVSLGTPVAIAANTTYIVSYHAGSGYHAQNGFFATAYRNGPVEALADGTDGPNGVYGYGAPGTFPTSTFGSTAYFVDIVFEETIGPDLDPPDVVSSSPTSGATDVDAGTVVQATLNEPLDPASVSGASLVLDGSGPVLGVVAYDDATRTVSFTPDAPLAYDTSHTATLSGVTDVAGNPIAASFVWSFVTESEPPPPPHAGPGGPILVIAGEGNPFGRYLAEVLRIEGIGYFTSADLGDVDASLLSSHEIVLLGETPLTAPQVTLLTDYVNAGGGLIAMRPDPQLAPLLGLTGPSGTIAEGYIAIDTANPIGAGLPSETLQYHGTADLYTLAGATELAALYSDATTATPSPAVTVNPVGGNGGFAAAFTYDLARSVVTTRQGNPAWAGQERDGTTPIRANDMFYGASASDPQPDWIDLDKVAIPQADEQQRLLARLAAHVNDGPMPRFWYFPSGHRAVVILTGDQHGCCGSTQTRFENNLVASAPGCSVDDWECVRSSSYIYTGGAWDDATALSYHQQGFELGVHVNTGCSDFTPASLEANHATQLAGFAVQFPSLPRQDSERTHCITWSDWSTQPETKLAYDIRLDVNYYYWPPGWIQDRPGMFTGSGMPMRFAQLDGTMIDVFQAPTQMTDESGQSYPFTVDTLLDRAIGVEEYYGAFTANIHSDGATESLADAVVASAQARGVPVVSGRQILQWLDGRNASTYSSIAWDGSQLTFDITRDAQARNLEGLLPAAHDGIPLVSLTRDGQPVAYVMDVVKGAAVVAFDAQSGAYVATYSADSMAPVVSNLSVVANGDGTATITWDTDEVADAVVDFGASPTLLLDQVSDPTLQTSHSLLLTGLAPNTTYYYRASSQDIATNLTTEPPLASMAASFYTPLDPAFICAADVTTADFQAGSFGESLVLSASGDGGVTLAPALVEEFDGSALPVGWSGELLEGSGSISLSAGAVEADGALVYTDNQYAVGQSLAFTATFAEVPRQRVGVGETLAERPRAKFSTEGSPLALKAVSSQLSLPEFRTVVVGFTFDVPHDFRIEWSDTVIDYYVDDVLVASHALSIMADQRAVIRDEIFDGIPLIVDRVEMTAIPPSNSFLSRIFDAGDIVPWDAVEWTATLPVGTQFSVSVRAGETLVPDGSWTAFQPVTAPGDRVVVVGRYAQYAFDLTTADLAVSPFVDDVSLYCGDEPAVDADGDGVWDAYETNTGVYLSPTNTGTDPTLFDTDGDGGSDGLEVQVGTDPNDANSVPPAVPVTGVLGLPLLAAALLGTARYKLRRRRD